MVGNTVTMNGDPVIVLARNLVLREIFATCLDEGVTYSLDQAFGAMTFFRGGDDFLFIIVNPSEAFASDSLSVKVGVEMLGKLTGVSPKLG